MKVLMFLPRFHPLILSGRKRQTIRRERRRPVRPGDELSLRAWLDRPYRSKQRELAAARCEGVLPVSIHHLPTGRGPSLAIWLGRDRLGPMEAEAFARDDGFESLADMAEHWRAKHRVDAGPFEGVVIQWRPDLG